MATINWNNGQLIELAEGDTATAEGLNDGQLYGFFFYNEAEHDATTTVEVTWSNAQPPKKVRVHGTTAEQGPASVLLVYGDETNTVSASIIEGNPGANLGAFVCSVGMPRDTGGITNLQLPSNGQPQPFKRLTRYFDVPASHWYDLTIESDVNQFIVVQFTEMQAQVIVVKSTANPKDNIFAVGAAEKMYTIQHTTNERKTVDLQGDGTQAVWMNAASVQDSQRAAITLQSLSVRSGRPDRRVDPALSP